VRSRTGHGLLTYRDVAINVPAGGQVNGFVFANEILSDPQAAELAAILGLGESSQDVKCRDAALRQQFDTRVSEIIAAIQAGTVDSSTQAKLDQQLHLAESIHFD
jgi:hypothetical protein